LICLPHAGASATVFHQWPAALPDDVEVFGAQLPGRSYRLSEPPFTRMAPLVRAIEAEITPHLDVPFILFGHSMGALVAFELARLLRRGAAPVPRALIVTGRAAPQLHRPSDLHLLPQSAFLEMLHARYDMPRDQLDNEALMNLALPPLRSDFELLETWRYADDAPLDLPVSAVAGSQDTMVTRAELAAWALCTTGPFQMRQMPGSHHFLIDHRAAWLDVLGRLVRD
jgi:surfactin synthase thioesterase subunit